jgi:bifunctional non-homologous end joining protein LigD
MLPLASGRPLTLVRCPRGREGACFFQKHADSGPHPEKGTPLGLGRVPIVERGAKSPVDYWSLEDARGLTSLVQRGVLEIHLAGARAAAVESPDRLVIDLDPDEAISWESLARAAEEVRERWRQFGLESFLLSTGGKGLHIVAPVSPPRQGSWGWDEARALSEVIAVGMAADSPQRFVAQAAKDARRGRIFVDYLRNGRGATAIAPYSTRARPGAPVAVPLSWDAVKAGTERPFMTVKDWLAKPRQDPWRAYEAVARQVPRLPRERRASTGRSVRAAPAREAGR